MLITNRYAASDQAGIVPLSVGMQWHDDHVALTCTPHKEVRDRGGLTDVSFVALVGGRVKWSSIVPAGYADEANGRSACCFVCVICTYVCACVSMPVRKSCISTRVGYVNAVNQSVCSYMLHACIHTYIR